MIAISHDVGVIIWVYRLSPVVFSPRFSRGFAETRASRHAILHYGTSVGLAGDSCICGYV